MKKVFVALSGGVDSAVSAHILKKDGWDVTGVFIRVWQPDFLPCSQDEEERAAMRVAAHLGIPFKTLDLSKEYKEEVVDVMISEYKKGRTPNPDVLCNESIKFGGFLDYALNEGAEKIATGHHAQVIEKKLVRGADASKDQAYFLWKLTEKELSHTLMPIGHMSKDEVRKYAEENNLPSAYKPDSQGLCFIGHVDMKTFLLNFIETSNGDVLNESGEVVGTHDGSELVTLGQRGGFTITKKEEMGNVHYVVGKDISKNTITVSENFNNEENLTSSLTLTDSNIENGKYVCEIRYHGEKIECEVQDDVVTLSKPVLMAPGQSLVAYERDVCVGGGIVT
ncbi:tRNA 2-thiouridine(34) synthase MnmA [Candidatus Kaiserbacteria bacterium]|nr:MAG: tRNA 2-thiouridine(34) synthase MnmA [Candidatus Kaiserbacteria bacterium]